MADNRNPPESGSEGGKNVYFQKNIFIFSFPGSPPKNRAQNELPVQRTQRTVGGDNEVNA